MELFETATLLESLEQVKKPTNFLSDRYFPTSKNTDVFKTNKVLVEYRKGARKVAPFISPRENGVALENYGEYMREYVPPVIGMRKTLTIDDLNKRGFGEALYTAMAPADREATLLVRDMADLRDVIKRRQEVMAAEVLFNNSLNVQEYGEDGKKGKSWNMKFYEGDTNPAVYTPTANWADTKASGKQILADVAAMIKMLSKRGIPATEVLMAPDVADVFLANEYIHELLDNRRIEIGQLKPIELPDGVSRIATLNIKGRNIDFLYIHELLDNRRIEIGQLKPIELPDGVSRIATLNIKGRNIDFLTYDEEYFDDESGTEKPYIPSGYIVLLAPGCGHTVYGGITQMEKDESFHTYAGEAVPRHIVDIAGNTKMVSLRSAPLLLPHLESPWVVAQVIKG